MWFDKNMARKINKLKMYKKYYGFAKGLVRLFAYSIRIHFSAIRELFNRKVFSVAGIKFILRKKLRKIVKKLKNNYWIYDESTGKYIKPEGGKNGKI